jgi:hypothetical protein
MLEGTPSSHSESSFIMICDDRSAKYDQQGNPIQPLNLESRVAGQEETALPFRHKAAGHKHLYPLRVPWIILHDYFPAS